MPSLSGSRARPAPTFHTVGLTDFLCLIKVGEFCQVPLPQGNLSDLLGLVSEDYCCPMQQLKI